MMHCLSGTVNDCDFPVISHLNVEPGVEFYFTTDGAHGNIAPPRFSEIVCADASLVSRVEHLLIEATGNAEEGSKVNFHFGPDDRTIAALKPII
jgi:hypothetical protein